MRDFPIAHILVQKPHCRLRTPGTDGAYMKIVPGPYFTVKVPEFVSKPQPLAASIRALRNLWCFLKQPDNQKPASLLDQFRLLAGVQNDAERG